MERLVCGGDEVSDRLLKLTQEVWEEEQVVGGWKDAKIIAIPKQSIGYVITGRESLTLMWLVEYHSGTQIGYGYVDMTRYWWKSARNVMNPCLCCLWISRRHTIQCLGRLSGGHWKSVVFHPPCCISSSPFMRACMLQSEQERLRQQCTIAPSLFNVYCCAVVAYWQEGWPQSGMMVKYKHG